MHTAVAEIDSQTLDDEHRAELLALARRRGVTSVRVFGSMSRGDGSEDSDVDLLGRVQAIELDAVAVNLAVDNL